MKQNKTNLLLAVILIFVAAIFKVITYPNTYSPIIAMALFGGAVIKDRRFAIAMPLLAMLLSDAMLEIFNIAKGFYGWGQLSNYVILGIIAMFAFRLRKVNAINVIGFSLGSSLIFFLLSNLSYFVIDNRIYHTYPNSFRGLISCYYMAIPFIKVHIDLIFSGILFGTYFLMSNYLVNEKTAAA